MNQGREMFESALDYDYRYKYADWVKRERKYPKDI